MITFYRLIVCTVYIPSKNRREGNRKGKEGKHMDLTPVFQGRPQPQTKSDSTQLTLTYILNLHWLPVEARINFKILLITYKMLWAIYQLFRIYHRKIPPTKNTEIINSFTVMYPIYQIQFLWWTRFFSSSAGIMELKSRVYQKSRNI